MKWFLSVFVFFATMPCVASADIGSIDRRTYVDWAEHPDIVRICTKTGCGTGQFISAGHILTSKEVANCCGYNDKEPCVVHTIGSEQPISAILFSVDGGLNNCEYTESDASGETWALLSVTTPKYAFNRVKSNKIGLKVAQATQPESNIFRAGFGSMKVLSDDDIKNIKTAYVKWLTKVYPNNRIKRNRDAARGADLEWGKYSIYENDGAAYNTFLTEFNALTGQDFLKDYLNDQGNLKIVRNCEITEKKGLRISHNCDGWRGDSGSALLNQDGMIVGVFDGHLSVVGGEKNGGVAVDRVKDEIDEAQRYPVYATAGKSNNEVIYTRADGSQYRHVGGSRPWRNNNPGALVWTGTQKLAIGKVGKQTDGKKYFAVFPNYESGYQSLLWQIEIYRDNGRTIEETIHKYAPPTSNDTARYIRNVSSAIGVPSTTKLSDIPGNAWIHDMAEMIQTIEGYHVQGTKEDF